MTRVLVVDDSATTRRIVRRALIMSGVANSDIREACDGLDALQKVVDDPPQLVLSDVNMPELDGFGLLLELAKRGFMEQVNVVMITSRASLRDQSRLLGLGAQTVIKKPFPVHALRTYIEPYLMETEDVFEEPSETVTLLAQNSEEQDPGVAPEKFSEYAYGAALASSLVTTLEMTGFVHAEAVAIPSTIENVPYYYAALPVTEGHQGRLWLAAPKISIEAFLNDEGSGHINEVAVRADALAELLNAMAAQFCIALLQSDRDFSFGLPTNDIVLGSDDRLDGGYVFSVGSPDALILAGYTADFGGNS